MRHFFILLIVAISSSVVIAEEPVYFADANLKAAVEGALGISDPTPTDMLGLTFLNAIGLGIVDPNGIQYATNLTRLDLSRNQISEISPVDNLMSLIYINFHYNQIIDISPVENLTNLIYLSLSHNQIIDISPVENLTNLTYLYLYHNQIIDISPVENLTNLIRLYPSNNQIINITSVENLTNLTHLGLRSNDIIDISPVENLTNLTYLDLSWNQISEISSVENLTNLTDLNLYFNHIIDISPVENLTNLTNLNLSSNQIIDISPVENLTNLTDLYLYQNYIIDISPVENLTNLTRLHLIYNQIIDISPVENLTNLTSLYLYNNSISDISPLSGLTKLANLLIENNNIHDISALSELTNLSRLYLSGNYLNCSSYNTYIPLIETNNPGIYLTYNPRPEICENQPDIDVSPVFYDFGDVKLFSSRTVLLTISNMGNSDLTINNIDLTPDSNDCFTITSSLTLPYIMAPEDSNNIEITFNPVTEDMFYATLEISSDDTDEPVVQVDLVGAGVKVAPPVQIGDILEFIDDSVTDGTIVGVGPGNSADKKLNALINMFEATNDLIVGEYYDDACAQLTDILKKCDGQIPPPDFVSGEAVEELVDRILLLMEDIGCE